MPGRFTTTTALTAQQKSAQVRRAKALERHIREVLDSLPPLPDDRRAELARLLTPTGGEAA